MHASRLLILLDNTNSNMNKNLTILGIETSCDETGASIYHTTRGILSNKVFSQIDIHAAFGGVVPELASRNQLEKIHHIINKSLIQANVTLADIDVIAVTNKPGLAGSLLIGVSFAKAVAYATQKPIIGVNHLEGHAFSALIEHAVPFEHICITASGGHTAMYLIKDFGNFEIIGQTQDDAAGEAFDKIAKLMNLPYPGGPIIEKLAQEVNFQDFYNYPRSKKKSLNFSFSGLKTAVLYDLINKNAYDLKTKTFLQPDNIELKQKVSSSLLVCICDIFIQKLELALLQHPDVKAITFVGGVACNSYIRSKLDTWARKKNLSLFVPSKEFCTDNAGMIAFVGHYKAQQGQFDDLMLDIF